MATVLITGASGNLGSLLTQHILVNEPALDLILMQHRTEISPDIRDNPRTEVREADLSDSKTLTSCLEGVDSIVHFAGVLFKASPEVFLHQTNTEYFKNLVLAAKEKKINKVILISFPHVEGPTTREFPAVGRLDGNPLSVHAKTRLEEEVHLFEEIETPISLRVGMVYGKEILMIDAAKWFARKWLLGVWREPTEIHLISKTDYCRAVTAAITNKSARGIYHVGDEGVDTLQTFLDYACSVWGYKKPWRMPLWMIYFAAELFEFVSELFGTASPLTKDFIDIGRVSYYGDTSSFRRDLLPDLTYTDCLAGIQELKI